MFKKRSLLISIALMLMLCCVATVATVASSATSTSAKNADVNAGVVAIPILKKAGSLLSKLDVTHYLENQDFLVGSTLNGLAPTVEQLKLTDVSRLEELEHLVIPNVPGGQKVYYVLMTGPFALLSNLPLPMLDTLIPSPANLPLLSNLPALNDLPGLDGRSLNLNSLLMQPETTSISHAPALHGDDPFHTNAEMKTILPTIYEVFNAQNGHLLAWG